MIKKSEALREEEVATLTSALENLTNLRALAQHQVSTEPLMKRKIEDVLSRLTPQVEPEHN